MFFVRILFYLDLSFTLEIFLMFMLSLPVTMPVDGFTSCLSVFLRVRLSLYTGLASVFIVFCVTFLVVSLLFDVCKSFAYS